MATTPYNDCSRGVWLAWDIGCRNFACAGSRCAFPPPPRIPTGIVSWCDALQLDDGTTRSLLHLARPMADVVIMLDSKWGTSEAEKRREECGRVHQGRLPAWPGTHCPLCRTVLYRPDAQPDCDLHYTLPHICVSSVRPEPGTDSLRVRLDSPTMLDFWLELIVPSWVLPPPGR